jgi:hypothetical protein
MRTASRSLPRRESRSPGLAAREPTRSERQQPSEERVARLLLEAATGTDEQRPHPPLAETRRRRGREHPTDRHEEVAGRHARDRGVEGASTSHGTVTANRVRPRSATPPFTRVGLSERT